MKPAKADTIFINGTVLTCEPGSPPIPNGAVAVTGGTIDAVGTAEEMARWSAGTTIDAQGGIIMPGLINTHTHLPMTLFRGLADDLPLMKWLNEHMFPVEAVHIHPESVRLGALLAAAELLLSGTTTCCDGYFHEDAAAEALAETGLRAVLAQGVIDFPAPGVPDPSENVRTAADFVKRWQGRHPNLTPSIFCHSPYTCSTETLKKAKAAARDRGVLFQIHVAETQNEVREIRETRQMSAIEYLDRLGVLDAQTLLVHAVWVDPQDIGIIARSQARVSHNPESNMKLGAGIAPVPAMRAAGVTVGLGTDGCASNNDLDLFSEMDTAAKLHKAASQDPSQMDAAATLAMATLDGAKAIGLDKQVGSLKTGKQADIIVIDTRKPHLTPLYEPRSHIVYAVRGSDVRDVMVAGKRVVKDREVLTIDLNGLYGALNRIVPAIAEYRKKG